MRILAANVMVCFAGEGLMKKQGRECDSGFGAIVPWRREAQQIIRPRVQVPFKAYVLVDGGGWEGVGGGGAEETRGRRGTEG